MKSYSLVVEERHAPWRSLRLVAPGRTTLDELSGVLARELGLAPGRAISFFRSGKVRDGRTEFASHARSEHPMQGVRLERLALRPGSTFLYLHDPDQPRWHELRVAAVAEGEEPLQVVECRTPASPAEVSLVARLFQALEVPGPEDSEEAARAWLADGHGLAHELLSRGKDGIERLGQDLGLALEDWLIDLPFDLAHGGLVDEAASLAARAAEVLAFPDLLADRAVILAGAGRSAEALAQVAEVLANPTSGALQLVKCGDVHRMLGDPVRAEELYRKAIPLVDSPSDRALVRERLVDLLVPRGREAEARALELVLADPTGEKERGKGAGGVRDDELVPVPRAGRNDPCPCGSGKKFKKCCGREEGGEPERGELAFLSPGLHRALENLLHSELGASLRTELARFAGPAYEGLDLKEALPLLPEAQAELAYIDWWLVDREERPGATLLDLYREKRAGKLDQREARVLARLGRTELGLYRIDRFDARHPERKLRAHDLLGERSYELTLEEALACGLRSTQLLRLVEVDGATQAVHEGIPVQKEHAAALVARLRPRWTSLPRAERAPALFQAWLDALHAVPAG